MPKTLVMERLRLLAANGDDACWTWRWTRTPKGYGYAKWAGRVQPVHRIAYEEMVGPIPEGLHIDHLCRNKSCVNPRHLEPVTQRENNRRADNPTTRNAMKTHCKRGHDITNPENVWVVRYAKGCTTRRCKECTRADNRRRHHARKARAA